jgi:hypothetical protein
VICVDEFTVNEGAGTFPNRTPVAEEKPEPLIVTTAPPEVGAEVEAKEVMEILL